MVDSKDLREFRPLGIKPKRVFYCPVQAVAGLRADPSDEFEHSPAPKAVVPAMSPRSEKAMPMTKPRLPSPNLLGEWPSDPPSRNGLNLLGDFGREPVPRTDTESMIDALTWGDSDTSHHWRSLRGLPDPKMLFAPAPEARPVAATKPLADIGKDNLREATSDYLQKSAVLDALQGQAEAVSVATRRDPRLEKFANGAKAAKGILGGAGTLIDVYGVLNADNTLREGAGVAASLLGALSGSAAGMAAGAATGGAIGTASGLSLGPAGAGAGALLGGAAGAIMGEAAIKTAYDKAVENFDGLGEFLEAGNNEIAHWKDYGREIIRGW